MSKRELVAQQFGRLSEREPTNSFDSFRRLKKLMRRLLPLLWRRNPRSPRTGSRPRRTQPGPSCEGRRRRTQLPFSDLCQTKRRPALVLAVLQGDDLILCQITSQTRADAHSVQVDASDFVSGGLNQSSRIRPNRLFTADSGIIVYRAGHVSAERIRETIDKLVSILDEK